MLLRSGMDHAYRDLTEYIAGARQHLAGHGRLLLGTGDSADIVTVNRIASNEGYRLQTLACAEMPLGEDTDARIRYMLLELVKRGD